MCGRFALTTSRNIIAERYFGLSVPEVAEPARYNIAPGGPITAVRQEDTGEAPKVEASHWGFHPSWASSDAPTPINIRAEKAATSAYFRSAFAHRRCLIPASGWFEWKVTETGKQPFYVTLKEADPDEVMFFAGLWEPTGTEDATCCGILTEPAAPAFADIHHRQPVVLDPEYRCDWLDGNLTTREDIRRAARRLPADRLEAYAVSTRVNSTKNDDAQILARSDITPLV